MAPSTIALAVCSAYLLVTLVMGIVPGLTVSKSVTGFVAADRSMNVLLLYFILGASIFSSFAFLGGPGWAYSRGAAAFYILGYGIIGMAPVYFMGPRTWKLGVRFGFVTQAELLAYRYKNRAISTVLAVVSVIAFIPYLTIQMKGAGYILETITEGLVPAWVGAGVTYGIVLIYVAYSGVLGVGWTNALQGVFMMIIAWFLGLYLPNQLYGGVGAMFEAIAESPQGAMLQAPGLSGAGTPWDWWGFSSAVVVSAVGFSMWPHLFMKHYAARNERTIRLTAVLYPTFQLFLVPILIIGFAAVLMFPGVTPADSILPYVLTQIELSPWLIGLVCVGTLAASMSSGDSILHAAASIGVRDGVRSLFPNHLSEQAERFWIRVLVFVIGFVAFWFAVVSEISLVNLLLASYGGIAQIFPIAFAAFYWPRATGKGALAGLVIGILINGIFLFAPDLKPWPTHEGVYGLLANVLVFVTVSLNTKPEPESVVRAFVYPE